MVSDFSAPISKSVRNVGCGGGICKERSDGIASKAKRHPRPSDFSHKCCAFACPLAVPDICTRLGAPLTSVDRCASSSQTTYRSFPYCTRKLTHFVAPPLPEKSFGLFGNPVMLPSSSTGRGRVCSSKNPSDGVESDGWMTGWGWVNLKNENQVHQP